jgi:predicted dehydrogenase
MVVEAGTSDTGWRRCCGNRCLAALPAAPDPRMIGVHKPAYGKCRFSMGCRCSKRQKPVEETRSMNASAVAATTPVRWGILGAARIARGKVVPGMVASPFCQPQAIAARDLGRAKALADEFGIPSFYDSYEALLDDPEVEAVYVALPNHLHVRWALMAAQKGKHVLCEKPIALTTSEAEALRGVPSNVRISEAFMVRQQPRWARLREILRSGEYGAPRAVQMLLSFFMDNPQDFRNRPEFGGGGIYDLGCYTSMTARYVFEAEPLRVMALAEIATTGSIRLRA